jgi:hypothetical protein
MIYLCLSVYTKWVVSWGGAYLLERWHSAWNWFGYFHQSTEGQIKFATKLLWVFITLWFIAGLFVPELRIKS